MTGADPRSVYQHVLGDRFADLDPRLQKYFEPLPAGTIGVGSGTYDVAGSPHRWLWPVLRWMAWRRILFPEFGRRVPFGIVNSDGAGGELSAVRTFEFPRASRIMEDTMSVVDGRLIDRLGRRRGLEVALDVAVSDGGLRMTSGRLALRVAGIRIPLPRLATVTLDERVHPTDDSRQRVDVRLTAPLLGEFFRYSGSFTYVHVVQPRADQAQQGGRG